jgi:hypothetical protein
MVASWPGNTAAPQEALKTQRLQCVVASVRQLGPELIEAAMYAIGASATSCDDC